MCVCVCVCMPVYGTDNRETQQGGDVIRLHLRLQRRRRRADPEENCCSTNDDGNDVGEDDDDDARAMVVCSLVRMCARILIQCM